MAKVGRRDLPRTGSNTNKGYVDHRDKPWVILEIQGVFLEDWSFGEQWATAIQELEHNISTVMTDLNYNNWLCGFLDTVK